MASEFQRSRSVQEFADGLIDDVLSRQSRFLLDPVSDRFLLQRRATDLTAHLGGHTRDIVLEAIDTFVAAEPWSNVWQGTLTDLVPTEFRNRREAGDCDRTIRSRIYSAFSEYRRGASLLSGMNGFGKVYEFTFDIARNSGKGIQTYTLNFHIDYVDLETERIAQIEACLHAFLKGHTLADDRVRTNAVSVTLALMCTQRVQWFWRTHAKVIRARFHDVTALTDVLDIQGRIFNPRILTDTSFERFNDRELKKAFVAALEFVQAADASLVLQSPSSFARKFGVGIDGAVACKYNEC